jgi:hypothetical protein
MKYALLIYATPGASASARPADDGVISSWLDYTLAMKASGTLLGAEQLAPVETATSLTMDAGERLLTDGPFIETKEHLLGFYLVDVEDLDAALDWAQRMPFHPGQTIEVRAALSGLPWQRALTE